MRAGGNYGFDIKASVPSVRNVKPLKVILVGEICWGRTVQINYCGILAATLL